METINQFKNQSEIQLNAKNRDLLLGKIYNLLNVCSNNQLRFKLYSQLIGQLRFSLWDQLWLQLNRQLRGQLWAQLNKQLQNQLWDKYHLWDQLGD